MHKTDPKIMVSALLKLANDIQSDDGVANACIWEAANMIEDLCLPPAFTEEIKDGKLKTKPIFTDEEMSQLVFMANQHCLNLKKKLSNSCVAGPYPRIQNAISKTDELRTRWNAAKPSYCVE